MKLRKILICAMSVVAMMSASGCGESQSPFSKVNTYSAKDFWDITITGDDGTGELTARINRDFEEKIISECIPDDATDFEEAAYQVLLETIEIEAEPDEGLSNGDVVNIHVSLDEESLKQRGIAFSDTDFTYTVEGLVEFREIDIFKDVVVTYEGISPQISVDAEYVGTDEYVINNLRVRPMAGNIKNGDTFEVRVEVLYNAEQRPEDAKVKFKEESKEYTVEDMDEYVSYEFDSSAIDEEMDNAIFETMENSTNYGVGAETDGRGFFKEGSRDETYRVLKQNIEPVRTDLCTNSWGNKYRRYYRLTFDIENTATGEQTVSDNLYMVKKVEDVVKKSDGTIYYLGDGIASSDYGYSIMGNYVGSDLSEIVSRELNGREIAFEKEFN